MQITVAEAADALGVSRHSICEWYAGKRYPPHHAIDSEALCNLLHMDHRFLMAFLVGYDVALSRAQIKQLFECTEWHFWTKIKPKPILTIPSHARMGGHGLVRYSYRRILPDLLKHLETRNGKPRHYAHGTGAILPPPDSLPPDTWTFTSALTTKGARLPWARRTSLEAGTGSALELPERGRIWFRRSLSTRDSDAVDGSAKDDILSDGDGG